MTRLRSVPLWIAGTACAILFADAALSFYKVIEFRDAFPSQHLLLSILLIYGLVATGTALVVYVAVSSLGKLSQPALLGAASISLAALGANLFPLADLTREALRNKTLSLAICFLVAAALEFYLILRSKRG